MTGMMAVTVGGGGGDDHDGPLQHRTCPAALLQNYAHTYTHMQSLHPALHLHPPVTHPGARHLCHQLTVSPPQTHPIDCHLSRHWLGLAGLGWAGCVCVFAGMCWVTTHQIFDHDEYYTSRDPALLASNFTDILAFLSYSWRHLLGRPTITLMATHWLLGNYVTLHPPLENPSK